MKFHVSHAAPRFVDARRALAAAVIATTAWAMYPASGRAELPGLAEVERAVIAADAGRGSLEENWAPVVRLLADVNEQTPDPVLRLIKGHACLAANQNNESVCLFLSVQTIEDKQQWLRWTEAFVGRHSMEPIAHYFHGDAFARLERFEEAIESFKEADRGRPQHPFVLNARGVARAANGDWSQAFGDIYTASRRAPGFADAHANFGTLWIQKQDGAKGALEAFDKALEKCEDFVIARYGRGCAAYALGKLDEATSDIEGASQGDGLAAELVRQLVVLILLRLNEDQEAELAAWDGENPSAQIDKRFEAVARNDNGGFLNTDYRAIASIAEAHPETRAYIQNKISSLESLSPSGAQGLGNYLYAGNNHIDMGQRINEVASTFKLPEVSAGVNIGIAHLNVEGMGPIPFDYHAMTQNSLTRLQSQRAANTALLESFSTHPASGFKTNLREAFLDQGQWPFEPQYGLCYRLNGSRNATPEGTEK